MQRKDISSYKMKKILISPILNLNLFFVNERLTTQIFIFNVLIFSSYPANNEIKAETNQTGGHESRPLGIRLLRYGVCHKHTKRLAQTYKKF